MELLQNMSGIVGENMNNFDHVETDDALLIGMLNLKSHFIDPEIAKRIEFGKIDTPFKLDRAQVIFFSDGRPPLIRLNSEANIVIKTKLNVAKQIGEPILLNEIESIEEILLGPGEDPNCAYFSFIFLGNSFFGAFDFTYNKGLAREHLELAKQFLEVAESSHHKHYIGPAIDNLFSAIELAAKAAMLSAFPSPIRKLKSHGAIKAQFNRQKILGNVQGKYTATFNELETLRNQARYLKGNYHVSAQQILEYINTTKELILEIEPYIESKF